MPRPAEITTTEVEFSHEHAEFDEIYKVTCPECHYVVTVTKFPVSWNKTVCNCGRHWQLDIKAIGVL